MAESTVVAVREAEAAGVANQVAAAAGAEVGHVAGARATVSLAETLAARAVPQICLPGLAGV